MATEVSSSTHATYTPPARAPERNRSEEYRAEQQRLQQERAQRQAEENRRREPVVNTQGQTTGRIVNEKA